MAIWPAFAAGAIFAILAFAFSQPLAVFFTHDNSRDTDRGRHLHPRPGGVPADLGAYTVAIAGTRGFGTMVPNALVDRFAKSAAQTRRWR